MTGPEAVARCLVKLSEGKSVKIWTDDIKECIQVHPLDFYTVFYNGEELCRGINSGREYIREKYQNAKEAFIL